MLMGQLGSLVHDHVPFRPALAVALPVPVGVFVPVVSTDVRVCGSCPLLTANPF